MAVPVLSDYQYWFGVPGKPGITFGMNTNYDVVSVAGLHSFTVRSGNRQKPRGHGAIPGLHLLDQKIVTFEVEVPDRDAYIAFLAETKGFINEEGELHWKLPGIEQRFYRARVVARSEEQTGLTVGLIPITIGFEAADPRQYSVESKSELVGLYNATSGGLDWDIDWEVEYTGGGSGIGQDVIAHNSGNDFAFPVVKFFGPVAGTCTAVLLRNLTAGIDLDIVTTIGSGQILTADMDARIRGLGKTIISLDGSSRYGDWQLPRETFYLDPGDNLIRLEITGTSTDVLASISWLDTSI